jgi:hypothetical protein
MNAQWASESGRTRRDEVEDLQPQLRLLLDRGQPHTCAIARKRAEKIIGDEVKSWNTMMRQTTDKAEVVGGTAADDDRRGRRAPKPG